MSLGRQITFAELTYKLVIGGLAGIAIAILVGPVLVVLITSLTTAPSLRFPPPGLSFRWYEALFDPVRSRQLHIAAGNTLWVAVSATVIVSVLGVAAAIGLAGKRGVLARGLANGFLGPLVLPTLAYGFSALMFFSLLGFRPSLSLLVIGHAVVIAPFVFRTTMASLSQIDPSLLESSASLGAGRFTTFRRVTLPLIAPGIVTGAFLSFVASVDNVPVSLFLSNARTDMLPIRMWGMMESTLDVRVAAASGVLITSVIVLVIVMERLVGLSRRM
jgi:putative spermidine/putrescine transport system permease protein